MRKSPQEQILEARAALQRAMVRQRREDARQKIIIGATAWNWLCKSPQASRAFISHVRGSGEVRPQDKPALEAAIRELEKLQPVQG